jgi:hypothetical protein
MPSEAARPVPSEWDHGMAVLGPAPLRMGCYHRRMVRRLGGTAWSDRDAFAAVTGRTATALPHLQALAYRYSARLAIPRAEADQAHHQRPKYARAASPQYQ